MNDVRVVNFDANKHVVKGYAIPKRAQRVSVDLPYGAQVLTVEDQSHEGTLMLWVLESAGPETTRYGRQFIVTQEGKPFNLEDAPSVQHVGMWVDRTVDAGEVVAVTGHVLEVLDLDDE